MAEKRLMRECERIQEQEKQIEQEREWISNQLASTTAFLEGVAPATKMREKFLAPSKGSKAIIRDLLQKQLLIQKAELERSCLLYREELIGLGTSAKHLKGVSGKLRKEVQNKDASLVTDAAASHVRHSEKYAGLPPNQDGRPLLLPRCTWLQVTNDIMADAGFVFQNATRTQVHSASLRRSRGVADENFRLKIVEMIQRMLGKSNLARPFLEQRLEDCTREIDKAMVTLEHLSIAVGELKEPEEVARIQEMMRNQRPFSEFVDDSGTRALKVEQQYWIENLAAQTGARAGVASNLRQLMDLQASIKRDLADDSGAQDTDRVVMGLETDSSPIPPDLLDTVGTKKGCIQRAGTYPSQHHIMTSHRLPEGSFGQRSVSALDDLPKHSTTMPRLGKHLTMTSNLVGEAPPGFWQPPLGPPRRKGKSKTHHLEPLDPVVMQQRALSQGP